MMVKRILGPIFGFLLGIFLAVDFIIFGVIQVCTIGVRITAPHDSSSNPKT